MTRDEEYTQLLADIRRGVELHYELDRGNGDPDLALLQGDQAYAHGLARLAELGDVAATAELADTISLIAQAYTAGDRHLADAVWEAGEVAVRLGGSPQLEAAKALARQQAPGAAEALLEAARLQRHRG